MKVTSQRRWGIVLATVSIMYALCSTGCFTKAPAFICRITAIEGTASLTRAGTTKTIAVEKGLKLVAGDRLTTGDKSTVRLQFRDFATVVLGEKSLYVITSQKGEEGKGIVETSTELLKGVGLVKVDPKAGQGFKIKTPHVITGVLGTEFGLEVTEDDDDSEGNEGRGTTMLAVLSGLVSMRGNGGAIRVGAGQGGRGNGFAPPGLVKKFTDMDSKLGSFLQGFIKNEATGGKKLKTIFRYY